MTDRDKLIGLLGNLSISCEEKIGCINCKYNKEMCCKLKREADFLLDNGVIVMPCKVGDRLWVLWSPTKAQKKKVYPVKAYALRYDDKKNNMRVCVEGWFKHHGNYNHFYRGTFLWESVGKTVFLTRDEAEKALAERQGKNEKP